MAMLEFRKRTLIHASAARVFAFHELPDAFARLQPPWETVDIIQPPTSLAVGTRVILRTKVGPLWQTIEAVHVAYEQGVSFADEMVRSPFAYWHHDHVVVPETLSTAWLDDHVTYRLPLGRLGALVAGGMVQRRLDRMFDYRHRVTKEWCEAAPR